jgi:hypothetical protein
MAKPEWGAKHHCNSCSKAFYDMLRDPITCPSCGKKHVPEKLLKPGKATAKAVEKPKAAPVKPVDSDDDDDDDKIKLLLDDDEILAEEDVDLDDDDDDDSDLGVVVRSKDDDDL